MPIKVCKKCKAQKGSAHSPRCETVLYPSFFTESTMYVTLSSSGSPYDSTSSSCDTNSPSDSGSSGGGCD